MDTQIDRQTDRHTHTHTHTQTDMTENITYPHTWVITRMHSSRMRTIHYHMGGSLSGGMGVSVQGGGLCELCQGGVSVWGVSVQGVSVQGGLPNRNPPPWPVNRITDAWELCQGGVSVWGVSVQGVSVQGGLPNRNPPPWPVNRITDAWENITCRNFVAGGNYAIQLYVITHNVLEWTCPAQLKKCH